MREKEATQLIKGGKPIACPICGHDRFHSRPVLMPTRGMMFWQLAWANKRAKAYVCEICGHVIWFMESERKEKQQTVGADAALRP